MDLLPTVSDIDYRDLQQNGTGMIVGLFNIVTSVCDPLTMQQSITKFSCSLLQNIVNHLIFN